MERILDDPEYNHKYGTKTYCRSCKHCHTNTSMFGSSSLKGMINGKKRTIRVKPREMYCTHGDLFKINGNHVRWWGFSRKCPFNIYTHTCLGCGMRMCSAKEVCSGCLKNNERFKY